MKFYHEKCNIFLQLYTVKKWANVLIYWYILIYGRCILPVSYWQQDSGILPLNNNIIFYSAEQILLPSFDQGSINIDLCFDNCGKKRPTQVPPSRYTEQVEAGKHI